MVSLEGTLEFSVDGAGAHLEARGHTLRLEVDRPRAFLRALGLPRAGSLERLRDLARRFSDRGLTLRVVSRNRALLTLGRGGAPAGMASRLLGLPYVAFGRGGDLLRALAGWGESRAV